MDEAETLLNERSNITPWHQALIAQARAEAYLGLSDLAQADTQVQQAIAAEEISVLPDAYRVYGEICARRGDYSTAEQWIRQSLKLAEENEDRYLVAYAWRTLARVYAWQNQAMQADAAQSTANQIWLSCK